MRGEDVQRVFETILPDAAVMSIVAKAKFQERLRKLDALRLVRAMVIAAATGYGGRQADVARLYFEGAQRVVRGVFYAWFGKELEVVMEAVRDRALQYAASMPRDLPGLLGAHVNDWHIVDSTTVKLEQEMISEYPGTGAYAALKIHKRFSVGVGTTVSYTLSPAKDHDNKHLTIDESWRGLGILVDLGYASFKFLRDCDKHDVRYVIRLKDSWKPRVQHIARGTLIKQLVGGTDFHTVLDEKVIALDGAVIDADVTLGSGKSLVQSRLVGVPTAEGAYRFYLTNLKPAVGPRQIADLYRVRWEIESDNKLDKSCMHLDGIAARTGPAVRAMVHASMVSSIIACLLAHHVRLNEAPPPQPGAERKTAPIHPQSLARAMGSAAHGIAALFELSGDQATKEWDRIAQYLSHLGRDPNWRRSPSILDQLRGWTITPGRPKPKKARLASSPS
jgi:putative transposase